MFWFHEDLYVEAGVSEVDILKSWQIKLEISAQQFTTRSE